jgi:hypothetical protein
LSTGEVVEASTGLVIGYLNSTSTLANGTMLLKYPITPDVQPRTIKGEPYHQDSELASEAGAIAEQRDPEFSIPTSPVLDRSLEKRHGYALNCGDGDGDRTTYYRCSNSPHRYNCQSSSALARRGMELEYCNESCFCQKLFKYCVGAKTLLFRCGFSNKTGEIFDSTGVVGHLNQTTVLPNGTHLIDDSINAGNNTSEERAAPQVLEREAELEDPELTTGTCGADEATRLFP